MGFAALSVRQPCADLLVLGEKDVENRSKPIRYRGWLLIHASKTRERHTRLRLRHSGI